MKCIFKTILPLAVVGAIFLLGCVHKANIKKAHVKPDLPQALSHGEISKAIDDVYFVMGTNVVDDNGVRIQASRTMTIIRENGDLTLVNSIRLDDAGLSELEKLGSIKNVIRLGAFHGRDDAFYQQAYGAKLWAYPDMQFSHGEVLDYDLSRSKLPIANSQIIEFKTTRFKEALLLLERAGGILISCDSIKNWGEKDQFFDEETFELFKARGSLGDAKIDQTWLKAMSPSKHEIKAILDLEFTALVTAHGKPLLDNAKNKVQASVGEALKELSES